MCLVGRAALELTLPSPKPRENDMVNQDKLKCYTTAAWLRGYASSFDDSENSKAIVYKLNLAAALLSDVWDEYAKKEGL